MAEIKLSGDIHTAPPPDSILITPHDVNEISIDTIEGGVPYPRGFIVDVAGTIKFTTFNDNDDTWTVLAGVQYGLVYKKIFATGTTATGIHALA